MTNYCLHPLALRLLSLLLPLFLLLSITLTNSSTIQKLQSYDAEGCRMHPLLFVSRTVFLVAGVVTAGPNRGKCYNTDQVQVGNSLPCNPEAEVSFCCAFGDICLSNGLCEPSGNLSQYDTPYFTSTCTDYSWNSPSDCPEICNNNKTRQVKFSDVALLKCRL